MNSAPNTAAEPPMEHTTTNADMTGGKRKKKASKQKKGGALPSKKVTAKVHTGPLGGKFLMKNGRKVYL